MKVEEMLLLHLKELLLDGNLLGCQLWQREQHLSVKASPILPTKHSLFSVFSLKLDSGKKSLPKIQYFYGDTINRHHIGNIL